MQLITKKHLNRRMFLRGAATAIALPALDAMFPALGAATKAPTRMAFVYFPNGIQEDTWAPKMTGEMAPLPDELPRVLEPLRAFRKDFTLLEGLTINGGRALGDGPGDHGRAGASYLTSAHPVKTFGKDLQAGVSIDQIAAQAIGSKTRFASLELGGEEGIQGGNCDNGYSCAYSNSISWRTPSTPNPPEVRPRAVFERLFGAVAEETDPVKRARLERQKRSVLDSVLADAKSLETTLGREDRRKLDEYLYSIRDVETRIQKAEKYNQSIKPTMDAPPSSVPENYTEHARLMFDLMLAAFRTDSTRIVSFLMAIEQSNRNYREIGITDAHHGLTHHGGDKEKIEKCIRINAYEAEQFAYFLGKLKSTPDGDGTLFDHSLITYGSGLSLGHNHDNVPTLLTGGNHGRYKLGQQIRYKAETPLANLHVMMLDAMGVRIEKFADSNGPLGYLTV